MCDLGFGQEEERKKERKKKVLKLKSQVSKDTAQKRAFTTMVCGFIILIVLIIIIPGLLTTATREILYCSV